MLSLNTDSKDSYVIYVIYRKWLIYVLTNYVRLIWLSMLLNVPCCELAHGIQNLVPKSVYRVRQLCTMIRLSILVSCCVLLKKFSVDLSYLKPKFYRACNSLFHKTGKFRDELVTLQLVSAHCKPYLMYATECLGLLVTQVRSLRNTWQCARVSYLSYVRCWCAIYFFCHW